MAGAAGGAVMLPRGVRGAEAHAVAGSGMGSTDTSVPQTPPLEKFVDALPVPGTAIPDPSVYPGADYYEVTMREGRWRFHRDLGPAKVWGYWAANPHDPRKPIGMGYLGPTLDTTIDHPTVVKWRNELPNTTHLFQFVIDEIRQGNPELTPFPPPPYQSQQPFPANVNVWNVVHQHGGYTAPQSDGTPPQSYTSDGIHGEGYTTLDPNRAAPNEQICGYTNHDRSCLLWYHDHAMGMTSLNVYAGLAGLYVIRDPADERLGLPQGEFEIPLVLQDRTFHSDGSLAYTMTQQEGEDTPVVNGKAYPYLAVEPRRYRLRLLNGSNERFWRLRFDTPRDVLPQPQLPFWLIGTDGGLRAPLPMLNFLISPAERYDLLVDFSQLPMGTNVTLTNYNAPVHYPAGVGPEITEIMQFQVTKPLSGADRTRPAAQLRLPQAADVRPEPGTRRRQWVVYQHQLFGTMTFNATPYYAPPEDTVTAGTSEIWEYVNPNHDAHPMHIHLINFQVLDRQPLDAAGYQAAYERWIDGGRRPEDLPVLENFLTGPPIPADPDEARSDKDTFKSYAETVTRVFIPDITPPTDTLAGIPGSGAEYPAWYIHHCHILEHEDDDLMRPWVIVEDDA
ncbi:spore coat protein A [Actinacidiphila yanglinensis]|uniref:Spore coat protein A n=1 Tax=Actinacidiphila yanglinensis TaxID=310779 RepID=A0A1H6EDQ6_9ACTN|nr:multicopper oxidase domain-containing protein [Actinacidiphila yanglinensis]SEG95129.1 spore coat protein A [Actinacidiphila yanglinensis]